MAKNNIWGDLDGLTGEIDEEYDPYSHTVSSSSPSFNWLFSNTHGLPLGLSLALIGKPKAGKTLLVNDIIAQLHASDPEALVIKFDTEMRSGFQGKTKLSSKIDANRLKVYEVNTPAEIFDRIEHQIADFQQKNNNKIKLLVIDSINGIQGRRTMNADTVDQQQIGDLALTLGDGFKRILATVRKYKMAMIVTSHVRAEMDRVEIMKGNTLRAAIPFGVRHLVEYWVMVDQFDTKDGRITDESQTDMKGKALQVGHKIWAKMLETSNGPMNRIAQFTLKYDSGIANIGEEVAELGIELGIIEKPNAQTYKVGDFQYRGKNNLIAALEENVDLRNQVLDTIKAVDLKNIM